MPVPDERTKSISSSAWNPVPPDSTSTSINVRVFALMAVTVAVAPDVLPFISKGTTGFAEKSALNWIAMSLMTELTVTLSSSSSLQITFPPPVTPVYVSVISPNAIST